MREVLRQWKSRMMTMWRMSTCSKHTQSSKHIRTTIVWVLPRFKNSDNSSRVCTLIPFGSGTSGQGAPSEFHLLQYTPLLKALPGLQPKSVVLFLCLTVQINWWMPNRNFYSSVNFTGFGQIVNPTRDPVTFVVNDKDRVVIPGTRRPAVFLTTGVVLTCNLISPTSTNQQVLVKKIQVVPVIYEYRRLINFLGALYGKVDLYGYVSPEVALSFSSRKETAGKSISPFPITSQYLCFEMQTRLILPPRRDRSSSWNRRHLHHRRLLAVTLPHSRITEILTITVGFSSLFASMMCTDASRLVPIYDCRETRFRFDEQSFSTINSLPVYNEDLLPDSLVSVAYTVNSFSYSPSSQGMKTDTAIYFNVLFVLFLGQLPEESAESESEWARVLVIES